MDMFFFFTGPPHISSSNRQWAAEGSTADVECKGRSVPEPEADGVQWIWNNEVIDFATQSKYTFSHKKGAGSFTNTLHVQEAGKGNFGVYNCTVFNTMGMDSMAITLIQKGKLLFKLYCITVDSHYLKNIQVEIPDKSNRLFGPSTIITSVFS